VEQTEKGYPDDFCEATTLLNFDKKSNGAVTFVTDASSFYRNPTTVANSSEATAQIEF